MNNKHLITKQFVDDYNEWLFAYPEINSTDYKLVQEFEKNIDTYLDSRGRPIDDNARYIYVEYQKVKARYVDLESKLRKHLLHYLRLASFSELVKTIEFTMTENGY